MEFCLLGPLFVCRSGNAVPIARGMQQSLLAALLLSANKVVPVNELAEALWGLDPPPSARASLQNMVLRLRRSLADGSRSRIITQPGGYQIRVERGELDVDRFETLLAAAREAGRAGTHAEAAGLFRAALSLWRGRPLTGVPSDLLTQREVPRLEEMRLQALEARIDSDMRIGRHAEVITELRQLVTANPHRERLHVLLMLALHENGQQADALAAYQFARSLLIAELGVEPGAELRWVQRQILTGHSPRPASQPVEMTASPRQSTRPGTGQGVAVVPRQLPTATQAFTGRAGELAELARTLETAGTHAALICAITGMAGVGKTALGLRWAQQIAPRFPDGQLYADLRGFGPTGRPVAPTDALTAFLDALGITSAKIPANEEARQCLYRSRLAGRRMLIFLDNAQDEAQVRPLLPGGPGCVVIVTSRNQLGGLAAVEGAFLLGLGVMSESDAWMLLASRLGHKRVSADQGVVTDLIRLCARLPLALTIVAARSAATPHLPLACLADELSDARTRLDALDTGDVSAALRAVFSWSDLSLSPLAAETFRLLGLYPGPDVTITAAASLAGLDQRKARTVITELARGHLVVEQTSGRYSSHDLLRAYAAELSGELPERARLVAVRRLLDYYLDTATTAARVCGPTTRPGWELTTPQAPSPGSPADRESACAWLEAERSVIRSLAALAERHSLDAYTWQLAEVMRDFYLRRGHWHDMLAVERSAMAAAARAGAHEAEAASRLALGTALTWLCLDEEAHDELCGALRVYHTLGHRRKGESQAHIQLARVARHQDDFRAAISHCNHARRFARDGGHLAEQAHALTMLGSVYAQLGTFRLANACCRQALELHSQTGERLGEALSLQVLGHVCIRTGCPEEAIPLLQMAASIFLESGHRHYHAATLNFLADAYGAAGCKADARHLRQEAFSTLKDLNHPAVEDLRAKLAAGREPTATQ